MRAFLAALLMLFAVPAWAQFNGLPVDGQPYTPNANSSDILSLCQGGKFGVPGTCAPKQAPLSVVLGNYSGAVSANSLNATGTAGYQWQGLNALSFWGTSKTIGVVTGPYAGASASSGANYFTFYGEGAGESLSGSISFESQLFGTGAGNSMSTGSMTAFGSAAGASEITGDSETFVGNDTARDLWTNGAGGDVGVGEGTMSDGSTLQSVAVGSSNQEGYSGAITITGTPVAGDVISTSVTTAATTCASASSTNCATAPSWPYTISYTAVSSDAVACTATSCPLAAHLVTALAGSPIDWQLGDARRMSQSLLFQVEFQQKDTAHHANILTGHFPAGWQLTFTTTMASGTGTEAFTNVGASTDANNVTIGNNIFDWTWPGSNINDYNSIVGTNIFTSDCAGCRFNAIVGGNALQTATTATGNSSIGYIALASCTTCSYAAIVGEYSGNGITTGQYDSILGAEPSAGSTCITSGNYNLELGAGVCVQSPTANDQLSIQNAIFGLSNSGTGASASTGCIGFYIISCTGTSAVNFGGPVLMSALTSDTGKSDATICDVTASGTLYYGSGTGGICLSTSTARFKDNIEATLGSAASAFSAINSFMRLDTVAWNYKPGHGFDPSHRYWGWTAEQMENVYPALVGHDEQGRPNSVDMMGVLPRAVNAIQAEEYEIIALAFVSLILAAWCAMLQVSAVKMRKRMRAIEARFV